MLAKRDCGSKRVGVPTTAVVLQEISPHLSVDASPLCRESVIYSNININRKFIRGGLLSCVLYIMYTYRVAVASSRQDSI